MAATGVIRTLSREERSFYNYQDIEMLLGVGKTKAYSMMKNMREECIRQGTLSKEYPQGRIPKRVFNEMCMID